ncbi:MAG: efflux RND transporter periplasmic adaptor subunit [Thiohalomonadaceae bacterium]
MRLEKPSLRNWLLIGLALLIIAALALGSRAPPVLVDSAEVKRGDFRISVEQEGRTRVADRYEVYAPVPGQLARVLLEPGDAVQAGDALFVIHPLQTPPLDARSRAQAEAMLAGAEVSVQLAGSQLEAEQSRLALAESELRRARPLLEQALISVEQFERIEAEARRARASERSARFAVDIARHERDNARAVLQSNGQGSAPITVYSPVSGQVLRRLRQSEGAVQAGEPVLAISNLDSLEVEVDVLSADAVRLRPGMAVELERWGGEATLQGQVRRIEPAGFTRISALGVEEQRVWVIVDFASEREHWQGLGDAYRIEARFILWQGEDILQVPASALFRHDEAWAAYVIEDGIARLRPVQAGRRSGLLREVLHGLSPGEQVVLHPGGDILEGSRVRLRQ